MTAPTMKARTEASDRRMTVLYQGPPKSGKTHCALSWPNPLIIYNEANVATLTKFLPLPHLFPDDWGNDPANLEMKLLPRLEAREAHLIAGRPVDTIVLDSLTVAMADFVRDIQGHKDKLSMQDFGRFLTRGETFVRRLVELALPKGDLPRYNVIMTVHERDVTDDAGGLVKITPAIMGQLKDIIARWFDTVFICEAATETQLITKPNAPSERQRVTTYRVWSVPPDAYHVCGDGVGGGTLKRLPPTLDGTYPSLAKAWGLE